MKESATGPAISFRPMGTTYNIPARASARKRKIALYAEFITSGDMGDMGLKREFLPY
jgi:hypothetical protein